jgi:hypothetical protein
MPFFKGLINPYAHLVRKKQSTAYTSWIKQFDSNGLWLRPSIKNENITDNYNTSSKKNKKNVRFVNSSNICCEDENHDNVKFDISKRKDVNRSIFIDNDIETIIEVVVGDVDVVNKVLISHHDDDNNNNKNNNNNNTNNNNNNNNINNNNINNNNINNNINNNNNNKLTNIHCLDKNKSDNIKRPKNQKIAKNKKDISNKKKICM